MLLRPRQVCGRGGGGRVEQKRRGRVSTDGRLWRQRRAVGEQQWADGTPSASDNWRDVQLGQVPVGGAGGAGWRWEEGAAEEHTSTRSLRCVYQEHSRDLAPPPCQRAGAHLNRDASVLAAVASTPLTLHSGPGGGRMRQGEAGTAQVREAGRKRREWGTGWPHHMTPSAPTEVKQQEARGRG